jgi:hypothetical protein
MRLKAIYLILFLLVGLGKTNAQQEQLDSGVLYRVLLLNEETFTGHVLHQDWEDITFLTSDTDTLRVKRLYIKSIRAQNQYLKSQVLIKEVYNGRYAIMPSGYNLKKGEKVNHLHMLVFNETYFGLNDYFSLGLGSAPFLLLMDEGLLLWISPEISIPIVKDKINFGIGGKVGVDLLWEEVYGLGYTNITLGKRNKHISISGAVLSDYWSAPTYLMGISAVFPIAKKTYLLSENYFNSKMTFSVLGARSLGKNFKIDYGVLIFNQSYDNFIGNKYLLPWLGMSWSLNAKI